MRPTLSQLGLNRVAQGILWALGLEIALCAFLYPRLGLSFAWRSNLPLVPATLWPFALWAYFAYEPGPNPGDWAIAERFLVLGLFLVALLIEPQAQYVALALKRPLIDSWLAASDAAMRVNIVALTAWTARHTFIRDVVFRCYGTLIMQFGLPLVGLWAGERDRAALWEYTFNFFVCCIGAILLLAVFPAACPLTYYGFQPLVDQTQVAHQIAAIRDGTFRLIAFDKLDGLISFPSFHTAGALIVTWAFRHKEWVFWPLVLVNTGLIAATVLLGIHYFVDVVAGAAMFAGSAWVYRRLAPVLDVPRNCLEK